MSNNNNFSDLNPIAETIPLKSIPKEEVKYHIATQDFHCLACGQYVKKMTYHIHSSSINRKTPRQKKRGTA